MTILLSYHTYIYNQLFIFKNYTIGRPADLNTFTQFQIFNHHPEYKNGTAVCRHYNKPRYIDKHQMKLHLHECHLYQQFLVTQTAERVAKKRKTDAGEEPFTQAIISDTLSPVRYKRTDELVALMVY
jgi:hypothetical protein